jgi:uncharacterized protein (TIGR03067 family)
MIRLTLITLFVFSGTMVRADDPAAKEAKKLQGEWQVVEGERNGKKATRESAEIKDMRFVFKDNELIVGIANGNGAERKSNFKLDPAKMPTEIDITSLDGQEKGQTTAGIYKLDKDRLTICMPYSPKNPGDRPKEFKAGADDNVLLIVLERVKPK